MSAPNVAELSIRDLQSLVGPGHVRPAGPEDAVDGVAPRIVVEPGSVEEAARVLELANRSGNAVTPRGAGTKLDWGNSPARLDLILSTARMNRILEHAAGDLVVHAEAGATLESLQQAVAAAGHRLALDPPQRGATLGGIVAANASGPLRFRFGTVRDLLIGITYVLPNGTVAKSGGKVVKNVAGYDLAKLFTGSFGTLGLLAEIIFRLHPLPQARRTVLLRRLARPADLASAVQRILHSDLVASALEFSWASEGTLVALFEGIEPGVVDAARKAVEMLKPCGEVHIMDDDEARSWWDGRAHASTPPEGANLKIAIVPPDLPRALEHLVSAGPEVRSIRGHAGTGIVYAHLDGMAEGVARRIRSVRDFARSRGGSAVVQRAPVEVKRAVDAWGPVGDALPLVRRVKEQFDGEGIMNPGRFVAGI